MTAPPHDPVVIVGCALALIQHQQGRAPDRSIVVIEEPDLIRKRELHHLTRDFTVVAAVVAAQYQSGFDPTALLLREPDLAGATAVVPGLEYAVVAAAQLAEHLGLPGAGVPAARTFRDKALTRAVAADVGLVNPRYRVVGDVAGAEEFRSEVDGWCVLKPTNRQASMGVRVVRDAGELAAGWTAAADPDDFLGTADRGLAGGVLVEEAVRGPEFSVELLVIDGKVVFGNVTAKQVQPGPFPVETGHVVPASIDGSLAAALRSAAERLARAAGFGTGVLHSEWIMAGDTPVLVECAGRLPGDAIAVLISHAYGFPFVDTYLAILGGARISPPQAAVGGAAIAFVTTGPGTVRSVAGTDAVRRLPGVLDAEIDMAVGDRIGATMSSWDRAGHVLVVGADADEARARAEAGVRGLTVIVD